MAPDAAAPRLKIVAAAACLALLAAQLWLIGRVELTFDDAYYTLWSRSLAWGYRDHPPMIAAWIRASTNLFVNRGLVNRHRNHAPNPAGRQTQAIFPSFSASRVYKPGGEEIGQAASGLPFSAAWRQGM